MKKTLLLTAVAALGVGANAIVIDTFAEPGTPTQVSDADGTQDVAIDSGLTPANTVGGARIIAIEATQNFHPRQDPATFDAGDNAAVFDAPTGVVATGELWYGYDDDGQGNVANDDLNLNLDGFTTIDLDYFYSDLDTLDLAVVLGTNNGAGYSTSINTVSVPSGENFTQNIDLTGFTGDASLSDVDYIKFVFDADYGKTFALRNIEAVPEPTTIAALGLGALALMRRRRNK
jgi:hypothetical protein